MTASASGECVVQAMRNLPGHGDAASAERLGARWRPSRVADLVAREHIEDPGAVGHRAGDRALGY